MGGVTLAGLTGLQIPGCQGWHDLAPQVNVRVPRACPLLHLLWPPWQTMASSGTCLRVEPWLCTRPLGHSPSTLSNWLQPSANGLANSTLFVFRLIIKVTNWDWLLLETPLCNPQQFQGDVVGFCCMGLGILYAVVLQAGLTRLQFSEDCVTMCIASNKNPSRLALYFVRLWWKHLHKQL